MEASAMTMPASSTTEYSAPITEGSESAAPAAPRRVRQAPRRASDEDRDRVAAVLAEAMATGRLTPDEHLDRLELTYCCRTLEELAPIIADLPIGAPADRSLRPAPSEPVEALFSKVRRGGAWPVPPYTEVRARFGAVVLDLRQAVFTRREVTIRVDSYCGKVEILVPADAEVHDTGTALLGRRSTLGRGRPGGRGPVLHITGHSVLGHVRVVRGGHSWPWRDWR
jgi:hypothetical protein